MTVTLYVNASERNKLTKSLTPGPSLSGALRQDSPMVDPVILLEAENPTGYNYAYIPEFGRYYFIAEMTSIRTGLWECSMHSDPLMSFRSSLLNVQCILEASTTRGADEYLMGPQWVAKQKELTDILPFPLGLSEQGEFILITAGG